MSAWGTRLIALVAMVIACGIGARAAWVWQANAYGKQLAEQAHDYGKQLADKDRTHGREREEAAAAALHQLAEQQDARRALEARLQDQTKTYWKEMNDAQQAQARLRDRLATADLRLSVVVDAGTLTDIQRAARFFYLQQHAFGGKVTGQTFGTATTGPAINLLRIEENLSAAWQRLAGTYVENLSWLTCAERYDRAHTFFYMDPPYWQTAGYGVDFPFEEYERMADFMRRCKGRVMVSINDHPDIRRVFEGFHFECLNIRYSNTNQRRGNAEVTAELVIMNWKPAALGGLF